uniref:Thyroglobulin type-1 domain-containing protein n=1 Tax=Sander lucioperca TaxID=283035 RepID=A0A8C9YNA2_SANLU
MFPNSKLNVFLLSFSTYTPLTTSLFLSLTVAGITLLACVLIVGQAMIAYFLLSQRGEITSLKEQSNNLQSQMTKGRSVAVPVRMHMPMNALSELMDVDEEASTEVPEKNVPLQVTDCQLEAAGAKTVQRGLYQAQQCFKHHCWCVNPVNGLEVAGSLRKGQASCVSVFVGGMSKLLTVPDEAV